MFYVKLFAVAGVLLLALGTAQSQYKNPRGFIEQEEKLDYKDMIIKKLLMKLNDVLRDRRQSEVLQQAGPRIQQQLLQKPLLPQGHIQQLPQSIQLPPPCIQQLPPPPSHIQQIQQLPPPQIHQIRQAPQVRPALKHTQTYSRVTEPQQQQNFQAPSGCQYEYEEVPCPCGECPCCQDVQYEEVPCPCCEQQQAFHEDPFTSGKQGGVVQTGPIFTETFVSLPESHPTESPETEKCANCCMSQGPITHLSTQRCSHCTQQPQMKTHPQQQPQQQQQQPQQSQVIMVPGRSQVQSVLPHTLHPSFFTGFTTDDQHVEERIVSKTPFMHPKLNELLHASHSDTC